MNEELNESTIRQMKEEAERETKKILDDLENDFPGITEGLATALGAGTGFAGSLTALSVCGKVAGLSAPGITSGLAALGALVGGGMLTGIAVAAAPVAALSVFGYVITKKHKTARLVAALGTAISKLHSIQAHLMQNAEYFKEELAGLRATLNVLEKKIPS